MSSKKGSENNCLSEGFSEKLLKKKKEYINRINIESEAVINHTENPR